MPKQIAPKSKLDDSSKYLIYFTKQKNDEPYANMVQYVIRDKVAVHVNGMI